MRSLLLAGAVGGIALMVILVVSASPSAIMATLAQSGGPVLAASLYRAVPLAFYALSWRALIPPPNRPGFWTLLRLRWIGESVNALLPVAQVGGDLARARLLTKKGAQGPAAAASMVADISIGAASQAVFTLAGLAALWLSSSVGELWRAVVLAAVLTAAGGAALMAMARVGLRRILGALPFLRKRRDDPRGLVARAAKVDQALKVLLRRRGDLARAFAWHVVGWLSQAGETWLIMAMIGPQVSWTEALAIESLAATARSAAFVVPGGLGVQEGALVLLAGHFGVPAPQALALGIVKRVREAVVGAPAIVAWSIAERRLITRMFSRSRRQKAQGDAA
jgi:putative membrane protein